MTAEKANTVCFRKNLGNKVDALLLITPLKMRTSNNVSIGGKQVGKPKESCHTEKEGNLTTCPKAVQRIFQKPHQQIAAGTYKERCHKKMSMPTETNLGK